MMAFGEFTDKFHLILMRLSDVSQNCCFKICLHLEISCSLELSTYVA